MACWTLSIGYRHSLNVMALACSLFCEVYRVGYETLAITWGFLPKPEGCLISSGILMRLEERFLFCLLRLNCSHLATHLTFVQHGFIQFIDDLSYTCRIGPRPRSTMPLGADHLWTTFSVVQVSESGQAFAHVSSIGGYRRKDPSGPCDFGQSSAFIVL